MSQISEDLTPRPPPCPSENKATVIVPSVPDVSMVFDPMGNVNSIRPQCLINSNNFSRPIFNRPQQKFEPIIEHDHQPVKSPPLHQLPPPIVFGNKVEYKQQYLNHQLMQQAEMKQYAQQQHVIPQHGCNCHNAAILSSPVITPHIVPLQSVAELKLDPPITKPPQPLSPQPISPTSHKNVDYKEIFEILRQNQTELRQINENNEQNRKLNETLLHELQDYKETITQVLNKQNTIEARISELEVKMHENFNELKTMINTRIINNTSNNNEFENRQILPKPSNNGKMIFSNRTDENNPTNFMLSTCKTSPIFAQNRSKMQQERNAVVDVGSQANNGNINELFNKYEIKGALNRRSIEYSISSLNYLQRYGLLEEQK